ncbi:universal stress protein [Roseibaca sp. Y0-43]|uniref:universal stress protein n=1 Tax=Roseibaca sp. Y0-43 TaxID=2816854 RepID=UPI001D0C0160|nr:universal stress protein [Roseibaca sp. Y0-43]MCC1481127.1 universal stress protein [Roseibaca sp. Y0-43]
MAYKSLISFVTSETGLESFLDMAATMARRSDAHLEICCLAVDTTQAVGFVGGAPAVMFQETLNQLQARAQDLRDKVRARLDGLALRWSTEDAVVPMGGIASYVGLKARYSDLVLLPSPYGDGRGPQDELAIEAALFEGDAPVLVLPPAMTSLPEFSRIVLAWNQSDEALHAARAALPLLASADLVNVVIIDPPAHGQERSDPGGLLTTMLARHGVKAEVAVIASAGTGIAYTLQRHLRDNAGDLLVMGAYSHSRLRQAILGGTTRSLLSEAATPVFMMH